MSSVTDRFFAQLDQGHVPSDERELVEAKLMAMIEQASRRWPGVVVDAAAFAAFVAEKVPRGAPAEEGLDAVNGADLMLAFACTRQQPEALEAFERAFSSDLRLAHHRFGPRAPSLEDFLQTLRHKLFAQERPSIAEYGGAGELRGWLRVTAVRMLLDMTRAKSAGERPVGDEALQRVRAEVDDPELGYLKAHYRGAFRSAFEEAARGLAPEDRNALREHYVHNMSIDELATAHGIHRATAARRLARARDNLLKETRRLLYAQLSMSREELMSVMRLVESQLHVTLERLLKTQPKDDRG